MVVNSLGPDTPLMHTHNIDFPEESSFKYVNNCDSQLEPSQHVLVKYDVTDPKHAFVHSKMHDNYYVRSYTV